MDGNDLLSIDGESASLFLSFVDDEWCMWDKFGALVYRWPVYYKPTPEEVHAEVIKYLKSIGRNIF